MRKYKLFLDDTLLINLIANEKPDIMADTLSLLRKLQAGVYDAVLMDTTVNAFEKIVAQIKYCTASKNKEVISLAQRFFDLPILEVDYDICISIAAAHVYDCDLFVSWNYCDIVNVKTIRSMKVMAIIEDLKDIIICTPAMFK